MSLTHHLHHKTNKIRRLKAALILTAVGMVIEFAGGFLTNSLALISDAWHMLTHLFSLGMSYLAILLALRPVSKKRTYGFYRAEVLVAFINGIVLIFISAYLVYESVTRFLAPSAVRATEMLIVAGLGLIINGASTLLLAKVSNEDLNIRSAFLHEIGDMLSSVAVVAAGFLILYSKNYIIDPIISFAICILIVIWAINLIKESSDILLESTPAHLDIDVLTEALKKEVPGVHEVHHVHAWTIATGMYALTAHVVIEDCHVSKANEILHKINRLLKDNFHMEHTNIQFECLVKKGVDNE
ncbi:MAG: cation diffusion facilitator family transporter [Candidatus Omnitrophica bacterium]|nr:cation diffusion facilitator family transporter [Candidatus Omnitrophota bacterium]